VITVAALAANSFLILFVFPPDICLALLGLLIPMAFLEDGADVLVLGPLCLHLLGHFCL